MTDRLSLRNHFLIAMPTLKDPNFFQTVALICEHNEDGAMGIVVNRPLELTMSEILGQMDIVYPNPKVGEISVHLGGPVQCGRGFVIHSPLGDWDSTLKVSDEIGVASSRDILEDIAAERGPEQFFVALGYAGWGAGQLEREIMENSWLSGPVDPAIVFDLPYEDRWHAAAAFAGVDLNLLAGEAGHA
ncbi:MAG: YqgE/AlgH family protein [Gammaproteobacteria bacterium]|nr:YqgE/AlgH family protein [Gammaproteobacteria bacterium]